MNALKITVAMAASLCVLPTLPALAEAQVTPQARVSRINTQYDVFRNGQKGLIVRFDAEVDGYRGQDINFAVFFFFNSGKTLPAVPGCPVQYRSPSGQVTSQLRVRPGFDTTDFKNVELFIPYIELTGGLQLRLDLFYQIEIQHNNGVQNNVLLHRSANTSFYVKGGN